MTLLSSLECFKTNPSAVEVSAELAAFRQEHSSKLAAITLPTRKTEAWKYSAKRIGDLSSLTTSSPNDETTATHLPFEIANNDIVIQCINGVWFVNEQESSATTPLTIKRLSELDDAEQRAILEKAKTHDQPFEVANSACLTDALYIATQSSDAHDVKVILNITQTSPGASFPRVFIDVQSNSSLTLIERHSIGDDIPKDNDICLSNSVVQLEIAQNARVNYVRMDMDQSPVAKQIGLTRVNMQRDAFFESHCLGLGQQLGRHDLHVRLLGSGAECSLNGVCVTKDASHYDNHTCIEHIAPHCVSNENYRCIADDRSQIVFNGRIHIHPDAQKTLGDMSNKNLLLSSSAEIDTKPELEIYADDVKCAHGTTIGQLDEEEVYYLKTRGLSDEQARQMLTLGFILEIVRANPIEAIAEYWETVLSQLLSFERDTQLSEEASQ